MFRALNPDKRKLKFYVVKIYYIQRKPKEKEKLKWETVHGVSINVADELLLCNFYVLEGWYLSKWYFGGLMRY